MRKGSKVVEKRVVVNAPKSQVYRFFTDTRELKEWLCDTATGEVREGGTYTFKWRTGFEATGAFKKLQSPEFLSFTYKGKDDPGETDVKVGLKDTEGGTEVSIHHSGIGASSRWKPAHQEIEKGWDLALENLKSVLETGIDLRFARRPFLGIGYDVVKPEQAEKEGWGTSYGIRLSSVMGESSAEKAGLKKGDILVEMAGMPLKTDEALIGTLQRHKAGATVEVHFYRDGHLQTVHATLGSRRIPELPATHSDTVVTIRKTREDLIQQLDTLMAGATEESAGKKPAPEKWCAKEVLAHLIITERWLRSWMADEFTGVTVEGGENTSVFPEVLRAVLKVNPTLGVLRDCFAREQEETVALFEFLRPEFQAHKARYRRVFTWLNEMTDHTRHHFQQFANALQGKPL